MTQERGSDFEDIVGAASTAAGVKEQRRRRASARHRNRDGVDVRIELSVNRSRYFLSGLDRFETTDGTRYSGDNGLITVTPSLAVVWTGTHTGTVGVTMSWRHDEPELQLEGWDEVVEIGVRFDQGEVALFGSVRDETAKIPTRTADAYRLRVHAWGRDAGHEEWIVEGDPVEEHLLIAWPEPQERAPEVHRASDAFGAMLRQVVKRG